MGRSVQPKDIWVEMERREKLFGIAEKLRKTPFIEPPPREVLPVRRERAGGGAPADNFSPGL